MNIFESHKKRLMELANIKKMFVKSAAELYPGAHDDYLVLPFSEAVDPTRYPHFPYDAGVMREGKFTRKHSDGWKITGTIRDWEDYFQGVTDFKATHPQLGTVEFQQEDKQFVASSEETLSAFLAAHPPRYFDPGDI